MSAHTAERPDERRWLSWLLVALAGVLFAYQVVDFLNFTVDDVFIPMRYADNIVHGYGPVYNRGESVEGYSDPIWVGMLVVAERAGIGSGGDPMALTWFAKSASMLFGLTSMLLAALIVRRLTKGSMFYAALSLVAFTSCASWVLWSVGALEMTFAALCYTAATYCALAVVDGSRRSTMVAIIAGMLLGLACWARPEAPLIGLSIIAAAALGSRARIRTAATMLLPLAGLIVAMLWWRWSTYGDLLPNTFYAKTGGGLGAYALGVRYLLGTMAQVLGPLLVVAPFGVAAMEDKRIRFVMLSVIAATMVFTIYSSGDWMPGARFIIPATPLLVVVSMLGLQRIAQRVKVADAITSRPWLSVLVVVLVALAAQLSSRMTIRASVPLMRSGFKVQSAHSLEDHEAVGRWLQHNAQPGQTFATGEAGLIGYMNPTLRLLDLNGLMDRKIAQDRKHDRPFDVAYVIRQAPEYVLIDASPDAVFTNSFYTQIANDPSFLAAYRVGAHIGQWDVYIRAAH